MEIYCAISDVYDRLMSHVDYTAWVKGLERQWDALGPKPETVLDAGCGTGSVLVNLARKNYHVFGVDNSPDMLAVCQDKLFQEGLSASLLEMDLREMEMPVEIDAVICLCDTLNYFIDEENIVDCFRGVYRSLKKGGSFIFDLRTPYYFRDILADSQWVEDEGDVVLIWDNDFSQDPVIDIDLTFFVRQEKGLYRRFSENHRQKCYEIKKIEELLKKTGFLLKQILGDLNGTNLDPEQHERMYFVACKE